MLTFDDLYRKTMAILSESVSDVLGPADVVAQEVHRAAGSADEEDYRAAEAAFDALPGDQRIDIGDRATQRAHAIKDDGGESLGQGGPPFLRPGERGQGAGSAAE